MTDLNDKYNEIINKRQQINKQLQDIMSSPILKKYFRLKEEDSKLYFEELELYRRIKYNEYNNCNHLLVYSKVTFDNFDCKTYKACGCIKCGIDSAILDFKKNDLPFDKQVMYDYFSDHCLYGNIIDEECDLELAHAIYSKIVEVYPNIDEDRLIKYFRHSLKCIKYSRVSNERKASRVKRLSLRSDFSKW